MSHVSQLHPTLLNRSELTFLNTAIQETVQSFCKRNFRNQINHFVKGSAAQIHTEFKPYTATLNSFISSIHSLFVLGIFAVLSDNQTHIVIAYLLYCVLLFVALIIRIKVVSNPSRFFLINKINPEIRVFFVFVFNIYYPLHSIDKNERKYIHPPLCIKPLDLTYVFSR